MITKTKYFAEVKKRFDKKMSIDFWAIIFWNLLEKKKIELDEVWEKLKEVNKNQT